MNASLLKAAALALAFTGMVAGPAHAAPRQVAVPQVDDVDLADDGHLVASTLDGLVYRVDSSGQVTSKFGSGLRGAFSVAEARDGSIYVTGSEDNAYGNPGLVRHLTASGELIRQFRPDPVANACVASDPDGNITVSTDPASGQPAHLRSYDGDDRVTSDVVLQGSEATSSSFFAGCARRAPSGAIVLSRYGDQAGGFRIYDSNGTATGSATGMENPGDIAFYGGRFYAQEQAGQRIALYDFSGSLQDRTSIGPQSSGFFNIYQGLDINSSGLLASTQQREGVITLVDVGKPTIDVSPSTAKVLPGGGVTFDASKTSVPLDTVSRYEWDLDGDGNFETDTGSTPSASRTYTEVGNVTARVRATSRRTGGQATVDLPVAVGATGATINDGAQFTNSPSVRLSFVAPPGATQMTVSNDGGFAQGRTFPAARSVDWTLDSSGPERLPKTIYVRFSGGTSGPETYQDDVILDQTAPTVDAATLVAPGRVSVQASDATSGVSRLRVASSAGVADQPYTTAISVPTTGPVTITAIDAAGNVSAPVAVTALSTPSVPLVAPVAFTFKPTFVSAKLAKGLKSGIVLRPACTVTCSVTGSATIKRSDAIKYKLLKRSGKAKTLVVAKVAGDATSTRLRFTRTAAARLKQARRLALSVSITARSGSSTKTAKRTLVLKR